MTSKKDSLAGESAGSGDDAATPPEFDWDTITRTGSEAARSAPVVRNVSPTPPQTGFLAGRLPIQGDTGKAVVQLPEPVKDLHCALVVPNTSVLSDCYRPAKSRCMPNALRAYPINDREIEVILDGGDHVARGLGWKAGDYPGASPTTRSVETGVPFVEVLVLVGLGCGCDSENWASEDDWA